MEPQKTAVLLVNLGSPQAPTAAAVRTYLREFLSDPRVVEVNPLLWSFILNFIILPRRSPKSAERYQTVWTPEGSPLIAHTRALAEKLSERFAQEGRSIKVAYAMRYGEPSQDAVFRRLHEQEGFDEIIVVPLYPQYSASTTASVMDRLSESLGKMRSHPKFRLVRSYHDEPVYIKAIADSVRRLWQQKGPLPENGRLVLSFHGMPKRCSELGDPYEQQCRRSAELIRAELGLDEIRAPMVFQSRFGKEEWLQPYLAETTEQLAKDGIERVDILCPGFAADCLETIEEVGDETREIFLKAGGKEFNYIPCLNAEDAGAEVIRSLILRNLNF